MPDNKKEDFVSVKVQGNSKTFQVERRTRVKTLIQKAKVKKTYKIMAAELNGRLVELNYRIKDDKNKITFLDYSNEDAMRMYRRGISFVMMKAASKVFKKNNLIIRYSISDGLFCSFANGTPVVTQDDLNKLSEEMKRIINSKMPFVRREVTVKEAIELFINRKMFDKVRLFKFNSKPQTHLYYLGKTVNYFYGYLPPDTSYVESFELELMSPGFILRFPTSFNPSAVPPLKHQVKLADVFREYETLARQLSIEDVGSINALISKKKDSTLVQITEAMHEKKIANIADQITHNFHRIRVVLVAGPSSSGKTTFTKRLGLHLKANGLSFLQISLDNYFLDRKFTPKDEKGEYNFEIIEALDLELFNKHLKALIAGRSVELPRYDFSQGKKAPSGERIRIHRDQLLLIEGIHGLNDKLTYSVPQDNKFKIYASPINHLNFDNNNVVSNTDFRLIRRIVRDNFFRSYSADQTMEMWPKVRQGERDNIFVFLDDADALFNSSLVYEMAALKVFVEPLLNRIKISSKFYNEARRLLSMTARFLPLNCIKEIPPTSILREFIGGSSLKY